MPVSGSNAPVCQLPAPHAPGIINVPRVPSGVDTVGGVYIGPSTYCFATSRAFAASSGVKSIRSASLKP